MTYEEFLKGLGLDDEKVAEILAGMKKEKIYVTAEENIEDRYGVPRIRGDDPQRVEISSPLRYFRRTGSTSTC